MGNAETRSKLPNPSPQARSEILAPLWRLADAASPTDREKTLRDESD